MGDLVAAGYLKLGIERMLDKFPLLGGIANAWVRKEDPAIKTMGVGFDEKAGWLLYYAPVFVSALPIDQLIGVLIHEVRHILYGHVFQHPDKFPDLHALRIAQEITVNENLPEPLPSGGILLSQYPKLPADENTLQRYRRLAKQTHQPPPPPAASAKQGGKGSPNQAASDSPDPSLVDANDSGQSKDPSKEQSASKSGKGTRQGASGEADLGGDKAPAGSSSRSGRKGPRGTPQPNPSGIDNHGHWHECRDHEEDARGELTNTLEALAERGVQPNEYEEVVIEEASKEAGTEPGSGLAVLERILQPMHIPWQQILRNYAGRLLKRQPSLRWPSRRHPHLIGIVAGVKASPKKPKIMAVVDSSGSMDDQILAELSHELLRLSRTHEVWVVECDCRIHRYYRLTKPIKSFHGRGGTSFCPPFRKEFLRKIRPELIIYLTDGYGDAPKDPPKAVVLWLLTTDVPPPAPWGKVARIHQPNSHTPA